MEKIRKPKGRLIISFYKDGVLDKVEYVENLIMDTSYPILLHALDPSYQNGATYLALGTNSTAPTASDTTLGTEAVRKEILTYTYDANSITMKTFFSSGSSGYHIKEGGLFVGSPTDLADSGTLFSHFLKDIDNDPAVWDIVFEYVISFEE